MEKYIVIIEKGATNYSAFAPDFPGCITVGDTFEETTLNIKDAIELYLEELTEEGENIPRSKDLQFFIEQGIFDEEQIGTEYFIARVEVQSPKMAA